MHLQPIELLTDQHVAEIFGVASKTLANWRVFGKGPRFIKVGGQVRYFPDDVRRYLETRAFNSTSEYAAIDDSSPKKVLRSSSQK
ncbi:MAG: helix-turn-helix domain-containing protein [Nitrospira sp.]|nr:helix-turn-helix domain-containing protein [Nitrospira sp.]MCB0415400.1 helix-turn-helix domain-containing protein [Bdellovibrionales bacterium]